MTPDQRAIPLTGLDGTNPLGFLAALGTLRTAARLIPGGDPALGWDNATPMLFLRGDRILTPAALAGMLWTALHRETPTTSENVDDARKQAEAASRAVRKARQAIKSRKLVGESRRSAIRDEVEPLEREAARLRREWRTLLRAGATDRVASLGPNLTVADGEFRTFCVDAAMAARSDDREWVDFCAAFGGEAVSQDPAQRLAATPLALVTGSGHQDFLGTVSELMQKCSVEQIHEALFGPWRYADEKCSLRWDPNEDRRYALMARDPTAPGNKTMTVWGANRLAFEALPLLPCVPVERARSKWPSANWFQLDEDGMPIIVWPLWSQPLSLDSVKTLLSQSDLLPGGGDTARRRLRARGVSSVYAVRRLKIGSGVNVKFNFSPSAPVWT
jgi:hypothetical protein